MAEHPGLRIGEDLAFPPDVVTETLLIIAKRGSGKTHCASVLVEEMVSAGLPVAVIDPIGVWWGLPAAPRPVTPAPRPAERPRPAPAAGGEAMALGKAQRAILTVLAQFPGGRTKRQLGMLAGYSAKGGGFGNALSALRSAGLIERGEPITITGAGIAALGGDRAPLPEGPALAEHWIAQLGRAEGLILRALLDAWPSSLAKGEIAARTGYSADGGGFNNALSRLRTLQLIDGRGEIRADETLARQAAGARA